MCLSHFQAEYGYMNCIALGKIIELCALFSKLYIVYCGSGDQVDNGSFPLQRCPNR